MFAKAALALSFGVLLAVSAVGQPGGSTSAAASNQPYVRPDAQTRQSRFLLGIFGPWAIAGDVASAAISTASNKPPEWRPTWSGFGKRFASNVGKGAIKGTTAFALEEAFKLDSYYYKSKKRDPGSRLKNALVSSFTARTESGKRVFGFPRIAGNYVSSIVATQAWYPNRLGIKDGLRGGTWALGSDILSNLIKEFFHK